MRPLLIFSALVLVGLAITYAVSALLQAAAQRGALR